MMRGDLMAYAEII